MKVLWTLLMITLGAFAADACIDEVEDCIPSAQCLVYEDEDDSFEMNILPESCGSNSVCCPKEQNLKTADPKNCGLRNEVGLADFNEAPSGKAQFAEFPSIVSIEDENGKICTGSLLDSKAVITSAACVYGKNVDSLQVRLGSWKGSEVLGLDTEIVVGVSEVVFSSQMAVPYNRYSSRHYHSSLAILILKTETKRNMFIGTSCLSSSLVNVNASDCVVVGWAHGNSAGDDLNVESVNLENCIGDIPSVRCATEVKHLELGSALMCRINRHQYSYYQQVGLKISGEDSMPSFYADLNDYKRWIDKKLMAKGIDSRLYTFKEINERRWWWRPITLRPWWSITIRTRWPITIRPRNRESSGYHITSPEP